MSIVGISSALLMPKAFSGREGSNSRKRSNHHFFVGPQRPAAYSEPTFRGHCQTRDCAFSLRVSFSQLIIPSEDGSTAKSRAETIPSRVECWMARVMPFPRSPWRRDLTVVERS